jgi:hypothetical protein
MKETDHIRIGSVIRIYSPDRTMFEDAEIIGFVHAGRTKIRVQYLKDDEIELRDDITNDNTDLIKY